MTQPNIIFLSVDAMRFDHTGLGEYVRPTTPTLNRMRDNLYSVLMLFLLALLHKVRVSRCLPPRAHFPLVGIIRQLFRPFIG